MESSAPYGPIPVLQRGCNGQCAGRPTEPALLGNRIGLKAVSMTENVCSILE